MSENTDLKCAMENGSVVIRATCKGLTETWFELREEMVDEQIKNKIVSEGWVKDPTETMGLFEALGMVLKVLGRNSK